MWRDDEQLLAALREAVRARQAVPREFIEAGQASFAWAAVDAELAAITYDSRAAKSAGDEGLVPAGTRAEPAVLRALTFTCELLTIEVQIGPDGLLGQVVPPAAGHVTVQLGTGTSTVAAIDSVGWFAVRPAPAGPFRLRLHCGGRTDILTGWVTP